MQRSHLYVCLTALTLLAACDTPPESTPADAPEAATPEPDDEDFDEASASTGEVDETGELGYTPAPGEVVGMVAFGGFDDRPTEILEFTAEDLPASFSKWGPSDLTDGPNVQEASAYVPEPAGFGHYCSMVWPGGGWAFASDTTGGHPCQYLRNQFGNGTVRRAGMFSSSGANQAVTWCDGQTWGPAIYRGNGTGPLNSAFNAAVNASEPECVIAVSPLQLPIFETNPGTFSSAGTGVDFARENAPVMDTGWFGATGVNDNPNATMVNFRGHAKGGGFINDHDGWDWGANEGTQLYTMANGYVIRSRDYQTSAVACPSAAAATVAARQTNNCINRDYNPYWPAGCSSWSDTSTTCRNAIAAGNYIDYRNAGWDGSLQGEVYVRHMIQTDPLEYRESFVVGYFHVDRSATPGTWSTVGPGTAIARVGNGGWTSGPHLHMTVIRETNVGSTNQKDRWFVPNADNCTSCAGGSHEFHQYAVEPFGWVAPQHIDPRGWMDPDGAMSPNLWVWNFYHAILGFPPTGTWGV